MPALLGYIDKAKKQKNVGKMHDLQVATTSALTEFYALHSEKAAVNFKKRRYTLPGGKTQWDTVLPTTPSPDYKRTNLNGCLYNYDATKGTIEYQDGGKFIKNSTVVN